MGKSARFIAELLPENGKLYAVDSFNGTDSDGLNKIGKQEQYFDTLFD